MALYEVSLEGFSVGTQTWDHILNVDGWADEVQIHAETRKITSNGQLLFHSSRISDVMGDISGFPNRIKAGTKTSNGGLQNNDHFPSTPAWVKKNYYSANHLPMLLWLGELTDDDAVAITPTIWEWDGGTDAFNNFLNDLVTHGPQIAQSVINLINVFKGKKVTATDAIVPNLSKGLPALQGFLSGVLGMAGNRPIGTQQNNQGQRSFQPKSIVMNKKVADAVINANVGMGNGVLGISYQDSSNIGGGTYVLYVRVAKGQFRDGFLWRDANNQEIFVTYGGAKFLIPNDWYLNQYGGAANVNVVPNGTLNGVPNIPIEGTALREWNAPVTETYLIQGGRKIKLPFFPWMFPNVKRVPDGALLNIP